ncbi:hypothetical protein VI817_000994 [Penicillium citrinum]|nr:hypothetical protein VI817_000994 [Penicillium citrinum]
MVHLVTQDFAGLAQEHHALAQFQGVVPGFALIWVPIRGNVAHAIPPVLFLSQHAAQGHA